VPVVGVGEHEKRSSQFQHWWKSERSQVSAEDQAKENGYHRNSSDPKSERDEYAPDHRLAEKWIGKKSGMNSSFAGRGQDRKAKILAF